MVIRMKILVTGGCGYIGSHTCVELLKKEDNEVIIIDNLADNFTKLYNEFHYLKYTSS